MIAGELGRLSSLIRWIVPHLAPYDFQAAIIDDHATRWSIYRKPRKVGMSMTIGHKACGLGLAIPNYQHLFISLSKDDAQEKINYARELHSALSESVPVSPIAVDNKNELRFANGSMLKAVYDPRGKARADMSIDEFAHLWRPRRVYRSALPIMQAGGHMMIASSVVHSGTMFAEIWDARGGRYKHYVRRTIHWWDCPLHCVDVERARREAPGMTTVDRVARFGSEILKEIFDNLLLEDFQMEYEMMEIDDEASLLPLELILECTPTGDDALLRFDTLADLAEFARRRGDDAVPAPIFAGYDIGRTRDRSEFSAMVLENEHGLFERALITHDRRGFDAQEEFLCDYCSIPGAMLAIDQTGLGMHLAENLVRKFGDAVVRPVNFSEFLGEGDFAGPAKAMMATTIKKLMQQGKVSFCYDRDANFQMHSVKKTVTEFGNVIYKIAKGEGDTENERPHHGDKFWARALACWAFVETAAYPGAIEIGWA